MLILYIKMSPLPVLLDSTWLLFFFFFSVLFSLALCISVSLMLQTQVLKVGSCSLRIMK